MARCPGNAHFPRPTHYNNHHTLDTAFAEDNRPWINADANGMLVVLLLRRIAYTLLTLFRSVTQRSDDARAIAWKSLMRWVWATLIAATATGRHRGLDGPTVAAIRHRSGRRLIRTIPSRVRPMPTTSGQSRVSP